jgi:hypothetical protein
MLRDTRITAQWVVGESLNECIYPETDENVGQNLNWPPPK